jgi:hypothetical protein
MFLHVYICFGYNFSRSKYKDKKLRKQLFSEIKLLIQVSYLHSFFYSSAFHPVVGTHPRCVLIVGDGPIKWKFSSLYFSGPRIRTHRSKKQRCVPTTGLDGRIGQIRNLNSYLYSSFSDIIPNFTA